MNRAGVKVCPARGQMVVREERVPIGSLYILQKGLVSRGFAFLGPGRVWGYDMLLQNQHTHLILTHDDSEKWDPARYARDGGPRKTSVFDQLATQLANVCGSGSTTEGISYSLYNRIT